MLRLCTSALALALLAAACGPGMKGGPSMNNKIGGGNELGPAVTSPVVSADVLAREPNANTAQVKHILISWKDKADEFGGRQDARGAARTKADAEAEVRALLAQAQGGANFDELMKAHSEDKGSAVSARMYTVTPDAQLVIEFRQLSLRLKVGEVGVCESDFGFHIIKRFE